MPFLCRFSHKETCAPLILIPFSLVLKNAVSKTSEKGIMYIISVQRTLCHYNAVTLPGDASRGMNVAVIRTLLLCLMQIRIICNSMKFRYVPLI